ncbi:MAG: hypothetical protein KGP01_01870, partial [Actinomycetales bacterium]|nr:hypothetical protein [Actinomycetales bacterium]
IEPDGTVALDAMMSDDARDLDASLDTGVVDTGAVDTGAVDTGVVDTGVVDTGPRDTGVVDTGPRDTGPVDTGPVDSGPPAMILCPLLGTPIPITCRSRGGLPACCGPGGICFCEQRTPLGPFCVPCP